MRKKSILFLLATICLMLFGGGIVFVLAYFIEDLSLTVEGDIILGPGKTELRMDPGDKYNQELLITNRTGQDRVFRVLVEDFKGTYDLETQIQILTGEKGPYSLKDYLHPEATEFTLSHGQRMRLPVEISLPENVEPGGLYGAVLVSASAPTLSGGEVEKEKAKGQIQIITQLATLFFIRVKGDALEQGVLKDFKAAKKLFEKGPISFQIISENTGKVHLSPYGKIEIKNILGKKIDEIELDPWFVMPASLRLREVQWTRASLFGRYTANISLNRGYKDIIDQKSFDFWVIPWRIIAAGFIGLVIIIWFLKWVLSHFEIKRKIKLEKI